MFNGLGRMAWLKQIVPRWGFLADGDRHISSFRWLGTGFDNIKSKEMRFIQYGRDPIKFILITKKSPPLFLLSHGWTTHFVGKTMRAGTTTKPLKIDATFRRKDENRTREKDRERRESSALRIQ